jgi:BlaI family transcriptional regulator, penicillinase repressor
MLMAVKKLTPLELRIMEAFWNGGKMAVREVQETFPAGTRPAYSTIQTTIHRLEDKGVVRRLRKIGNAHIFEAVLTRQDARGRLIDDLLSLFGGHTQPVMAHLVKTGKLTLEDVRETEKLIQDLSRKEGSNG